MSRAIWISIAFGLVVQMITLVVARSFGPDQMMTGWGIGAILRLVTLLAYGWGVVPALGLPLTPALVTLAIVYFVTTLVEPLLLTHGRAERGPTL